MGNTQILQKQNEVNMNIKTRTFLTDEKYDDIGSLVM